MKEPKRAIKCSTEEQAREYRDDALANIFNTTENRDDLYMGIIYYLVKKGFLQEGEVDYTADEQMEINEMINEESPSEGRQHYRIPIEGKYEVSFDYKGYLSDILVEKKQESPREDNLVEKIMEELQNSKYNKGTFDGIEMPGYRLEEILYKHLSSK